MLASGLPFEEPIRLVLGNESPNILGVLKPRTVAGRYVGFANMLVKCSVEGTPNRTDELTGAINGLFGVRSMSIL